MHDTGMPSSIRAAAAVVLALLALTTIAESAPRKAKGKRYFFAPEAVIVAEGAEQSPATAHAQQRLGPILAAAIAKHPQLVAQLAGAPDPAADAKGYERFLRAKRLAGAYRVSVEVKEAMEETQTKESQPDQLRLVVSLSIHMFGEALPHRTIGFSGDGSATIKIDVGKKVRPRDREVAWDSAAQKAVDDALAMSLTKLAVPLPPPSKK